MPATSISDCTPEYDRERASQRVLEALQECDEVDFASWSSTLYDHVDPDALDSLFAHPGHSVAFVEFQVEDATVLIWDDDGISVSVEEA